jgi:tetratricopeptide (TPR) repeat protein
VSLPGILVSLLLLAGPGGREPWDGAPFSAPADRLIEAAGRLPVKEGQNALVFIESGSYSFDEEGRSTYRYHTVLRVDTQAGLSDWANIETDWSPWFEERPSLRARVITRDGKVHLLDPKTVVEGPAGEESSEIYSDQRVLRGPLPSLEPGAIVEEEILVKEKSVLFDAGTRHDFPFGKEEPVLRTRLVIEAPASLPLRYQARLLPALEIRRSESGGKVRLTFENGPLEPVERAEPRLPPGVPRRPYLAFSTGRSWREVAARYGEIVEAQVKSAEVKKIAEEATRGAATRQAKVERLLERLHRDVRYTGVELGDASIVPTPPAEALKRGYGDCKDQATLLIALLRAVGIPARAVLLEAGEEMAVEPELPGLDCFDHVIVELPGDPPSWIDPTDRYSRAGELPIDDQGKLALVADAGTRELSRTPESRSEDNRLIEERQFFLAEKGPARVVERTETHGSFESSYRSTYHESDRKKLGKDLERYAKKIYLAKKLSRWESADPLDLSMVFWLELEAAGAARGTTHETEALVTLFPQKLTEILPAALRGVREEEDDEAAGEDDSDEGEEAVPAEGAAPAVPASKKRTQDFELPEPFVYEWRYRIVPPPGFAPRELPKGGELPLGPARLTREYAIEEGGVVGARLKLDTVVRRLKPAEFEAFRDALQALKKEEPVQIRFEEVGEAHLAAGRVREALVEFRKLARLHPDEPLHLTQVSRALLEGGMGDTALEAARKAVELDPASAAAQRALGWALEHDSIGRRFKRGSDLAAAEAAYRKAKELDPSDPAPRTSLADLFRRDGEGTLFAQGARLDQAIAEYQALRKDLNDTAHDEELLLTLIVSGKFDESKSFARSLERSPFRDACLLAAIATTEGVPAASREASKVISDAKARREALELGSQFLVYGRLYPQAAGLLAEVAQGSKNAAGLRARIDSLKKLRRHEELTLPENEPASVVKRFMIVASSGKEPADPAVQPLWVREVAQAAQAEDGLAGKRRGESREELPPDLTTDAALAGIRFTVEGDERAGFRVRLEPLKKERKGMACFLVREGNRLKIVTTSATPFSLGEEALRRLERGDLAGARQWLDWAVDEVPGLDTEDPLSGHPFAHFWKKGQPAEAGSTRVAAAALLTVDSATAARAIPILLEARQKADSEAERLRLDLALAQSYNSLRNFADLAEAAGRMLQVYPRSTVAFRFRVRAPGNLGRDGEAEKVIEERLALLPGDRWANRGRLALALTRGNLEAAETVVRGIIDSGNGAARDYREAARIALFRGRVNEKAIEEAQKAAGSEGERDPQVLQILAALYAESGKPAEARETILEAIEARKDDQPESDDWYVLGRIAEEYGEKEWARAAYGRVEKPDEKASLAMTFFTLARKRLEKLGPPEGK